MPRKSSPPVDASGHAMILDAAERVFGRFGYEGASMRLISIEAGVAQGLLHYHFKTKEKLYLAVFDRRASTINEFRSKSISDLFAKKEDVDLESVLRVMLTPVTEIFAEESVNVAMYMQMVASVSLGCDDLSAKVRSENYDVIAREFIDAIKRCESTLSDEQAVWSYLYAVGARHQAQSLTDRAQLLGAEPLSDKAHGRDSLDRLVRFVAAGIRAVAA